MHIILTHEQADFDSLASLLGAFLLNDAAIPVLPRRVNRNVRAFLTLYGVDLPFVEQQDLPAEIIEKITLVDTQSMITLKGMNRKTQVHVIDHHPLRNESPEDWEITVSATGANTTIFIETLLERDIILNTIQATLLLLGIYEDTGSLTYIRTTTRDLKAAAYLLEQGANLGLANGFLNHPLSQFQQSVYDRLRENLEIIESSGHKIVIACGNAQEMDEELSTVVHKLRDLLDPEALFVLVKTRSGIQMIARSTSDDIDVGEVVTHFGGGGHDRAAAALIKDGETQTVKHHLIELLSQLVKPAITVSQIMSRIPQLIPPETPVEEAASRMQRYGYEGYPVVKDGKVIGLLTRRAVDRALAHKLNLTAASLMDAGDYTVHPNDSIENLQRLMTESGWGQIPVIQPENEKIIGIVTRTDLIKTLTIHSGRPTSQNLADRLERSLTPERLVLLKVISDTAYKQKNALYIVGGFVRDLLLGWPFSDFDLVVEGDAIYLAHSLANEYGGRITSHSKFSTAKWIIKEVKPDLLKKLKIFLNENETSSEWTDSRLPDSIDLITARREFYTRPTALPTVEQGSIKLDLHRRDFTINTLALRLDGRHYGELHDYWGGLTDLRHGLVRVLHSLSFVDDPTRILRAVRFEQRYHFDIEKRSLELMGEAISLLQHVSGDRIRHEFDNILTEKNVVEMLDRLASLHLLQSIHTSLQWDEWLAVRIKNVIQGKPEVEWGFIDADPNQLIKEIIYILLLLRIPAFSAHAIVNRLKLSASLARLIHAARKLWTDRESLTSLPASQVSAFLNSLPVTAIFAVYMASDRNDERQVMYQYIAEWRKMKPTISGKQLRTRGVPPGPEYRQLLDILKGAWIDGKIRSPDEERILLEDLLKKYNFTIYPQTKDQTQSD